MHRSAHVPLAGSAAAILDAIKNHIRSQCCARRAQQIVLVASHPVGTMGPAKFTLPDTLMA